MSYPVFLVAEYSVDAVDFKETCLKRNVQDYIGLKLQREQIKLPKVLLIVVAARENGLNLRHRCLPLDSTYLSVLPIFEYISQI